MANPEHVEIVRRGAGAIADWRTSHPDERLDLSEVDLRGADLRGADLRGADLRRADLLRADLRRADLSRADLSEANLPITNLIGAVLKNANLRRSDLRGAMLSRSDLVWADFSGANLHAADLSRANFSGADLSDADLSGADLTFASLVGADLRDANLVSASLMEAVFGGTNLTGAKGLDSVQHIGPCVIDERTLRLSWPLPETFLRGCGLSDELIAFLRATLGKAIEFYSCFISYSSKDDAFAKRLHADLQDNGVRCWFAPEDLKIGERIRPGIDEAIRLHDKLLLILSKDSVQSPWVESEVEAALERERRTKRVVLFPIRIDDAVMRTRKSWASEIRRTRHIGDFRRWKEHDAYQVAFERLLRDLKAGEKQRAT